MFANFQKFRNFWQIWNFSKFWMIFLPKKLVPSGAKVCKSCRSWKMLKNAYLLAKIGFDTAEIEDLDARLECIFHRQSLEGHRAHDHVNGALIPGAAVQSLDELRVRPDRVISVGHDTSLFPRLVLGCITADFGNQRVIFQHFSRSTRLS